MKIFLPGGLRLVLFVVRDGLTHLTFVLAVSSAASAAAARALQHLYGRAPGGVKSPQAEGGSEFKSLFEEPCRKENILLFVIPPKSPRHNSQMENASGMSRRSSLTLQ